MQTQFGIILPAYQSSSFLVVFLQCKQYVILYSVLRIVQNIAMYGIHSIRGTIQRDPKKTHTTSRVIQAIIP